MDFEDMLAEAKASAPEPELDMSWLDKFRKGKEEAEPEKESEPTPPGPEAEHPEPDEDAEDDALEHEEDRDDEREGDETAHEHGGTTSSAGGGGGLAGATPEGEPASVVVEAEQPEHEDVHVDAAPEPERPHDVPVSLQHTDHQEDVQSRAARSGGGSSDSAGSDGVLPSSAAVIGDGGSRPLAKSFPEEVLEALRRVLRTSAVRELGVTEQQAAEFAKNRSSAQLTLAFVISGLDMRIEMDDATHLAAELFRTRDPLMGSVLRRLDALSAQEEKRDGLLQRMREETSATRESSEMAELVTSFVLTDRFDGLMRGTNDAMTIPFGDDRVGRVREKARDEIRKQRKIEKEKKGRPIR